MSHLLLKLNLKRNIWAERKVLLDELDPSLGVTLSIEDGYLYWIFLIHLGNLDQRVLFEPLCPLI